MRLGAYTAELRPRQQGRRDLRRDRNLRAPPHRYEVNTAYKDRLEQHGMRFCGMCRTACCPRSSNTKIPLVPSRTVPPRVKSAPVRTAPLFASFVEPDHAQPLV